MAGKADVGREHLFTKRKVGSESKGLKTTVIDHNVKECKG